MGLNPNLEEAMKMAVRETINRAVSKAQPPRSLHDCQHRGGLSRHAGCRWYQGHPRNDPEGDLHCAVKKRLRDTKAAHVGPEGTRGVLSACDRFTVSLTGPRVMLMQAG